MKLPTLYKKTSTGAIAQWAITVAATTITVEHGQVGGKIQTTSEKISSGKNAGRKNATAPAEQAEKEAKSRWTRMKKAGYVETISAARTGATDAVIEGGVLPMLAKVFEDEVEKITFPCAIQPKLDGHRCIAMIDKNGKVTLWTRTRKRINSCPHIVVKLQEIAGRMMLRGAVLDGELYNHDMKEEFEKLSSLIRKDDIRNHIQTAKYVQYHVYDIISDEGFMERISHLADLRIAGGEWIDLVDTKIAHSMEEAKIYFETNKRLGYEGSMLRLLKMPYDNKRSHQLLKVKTFDDAEFEITGVKEGRGKLAGHGIFRCRTFGGEFDVKMAGPIEALKDFWENKEKYVGRMLLVQFQGKTKDGLPRFPVGLRFWEAL